MTKGKYTKRSSRFFENIREINGAKERKCTQCNEWKVEETEFYLHNKKKPEKGYQSECKVCSIKRASKRQSDNRDDLLKYKKLHYIKNKEKMKAQSAENRHSKPNYYKEKCKEYRQSEKGKEKFRKYGKDRREKNHNIYDEEWESCKKYFNYECAYCGLPLSEHYFPYNEKIKLYDFHKEHVVLDGKNDIRNCVPSCNSCNSSKHENSLNDWFNANNPTYTYDRHFKIYKWLRYDYKKYILPKRRYKGQHLVQRLQEIQYNKIKGETI